MKGESRSQPNSVKGFEHCSHVFFIFYTYPICFILFHAWNMYPPSLLKWRNNPASVSLELRSTWNNQIFSPSPSCGPWKAGGWCGSPEIVDSSAKMGDLAKK